MFDVCRSHAERKPDQIAFTWLDELESIAQRLTFEELYTRAFWLGAALRERGLSSQCVLLLYKPCLEFIVGLLGCFSAGVVAVPIPFGNARKSGERWSRIAADCRAAAILTDSGAAIELESGLADTALLSRMPLIATDLCIRGEKVGATADAVQPESTAFLQYTSGSTGVPKGVMVSHRNVLANEEMIRVAFQHTDETVFAGWLPLFHDMGLIGNVLQPLYLGIEGVLMSPEAFVQKPIRWLRAISNFKATTSGAPNFAYDLCARRVSEENLAGIDLSSWRVAFNGAEPVRAATMELFSRKFARSGFRHSSFYPCYGMAEATLFVSGGVPQSGPKVIHVDKEALKSNDVVNAAEETTSRAIVGCGQVSDPAEVVIVDLETCKRAPANAIGEIWLKGPNVSSGYWNRPEETSRTFGAPLSAEDGGYLRTGDLGFLRDGELFVTGRIKELIILNGRNYYPHDLEASLQGLHWAFRAGGAAAFAIDVEGGTRIGLLQEVDRQFNRVLTSDDPAVIEEMEAAVRRAIAEQHDISIHGCRFVPYGTIPKTSSGKTRRSVCAQIYQGEPASARGLHVWSA